MARIELIDDDDPAPRRPRPDASARRNPVGGDVVASMKRGMRQSSGGSRLWVLGGVALVLLLVLNWAWLARIHRRVSAAGGWSAVASSAREWFQSGGPKTPAHRGEM